MLILYIDKYIHSGVRSIKEPYGNEGEEGEEYIEKI
jgi:hypothetical protein